jgi:rod shape-determining protein MreC
MVNKKGAIVLLTMVILAYFFNINALPHTYILKANNEFKNSFKDNFQSSRSFVNKHTAQVEMIEALEAENLKLKTQLKSQKNELVQYKTELSELKKDTNTTRYLKDVNISRDRFIQVSTVSYVDFNNRFRFYLNKSFEHNTSQEAKIYGLSFKEYAAGIVKSDPLEGSIAYLNGDSKCKYTVFIGQNRVPAILGSKMLKKGLLRASYIPLWQDIKVGEEVITSGMDGYFFEGYKVGKVMRIDAHDTYQVAFIKPYVQMDNKKNFFVIKKK